MRAHLSQAEPSENDTATKRRIEMSKHLRLRRHWRRARRQLSGQSVSLVLLASHWMVSAKF